MVQTSQQEIVRSGELVINKSEDLGINDPLTHLYAYINHGEEALVAIQQDIETDIAERLPKTPFINYVDFELHNNDFLSAKDHISMRQMSTANLDILSAELRNNPSLQREYDRAMIEAEEVNKLTVWFEDAPINSYLVFESLPIGNQEIAVSRIYKKVSDSRLEGSFVSLYNPSVDKFNKFRAKIGLTSQNDHQDELDILADNYSFFSPQVESTGEFIDYYVSAYDSLQEEDSGLKTRFGLNIDNGTDKQNGIEKVRQQPQLTAIYTDIIKSLASSNGIVTPDLLTVCDSLHIDNFLSLYDRVTTDSARGLLKNVITGITAVIDKADRQLLADLANCNAQSSAFYDTVAHYSDTASRSNESYESLSCPEFSRSGDLATTGNPNSEYDSMFRAYGVYEKLDNFGTAKIDVCVIKNCPSRGQSNTISEKTLVGGCGICVGCHKILSSGESPESIYAKENLKKENQARAEKSKKIRPLMRKLNQKERDYKQNLIKRDELAKNQQPTDQLEKQINLNNDDIKRLQRDLAKVA